MTRTGARWVLVVALLVTAAPAAAAGTAEPEGTRVRAGLTPEQAPPLRPGQYVDEVPDETELFYAVDIPEGVTPRVSVTMARPPLAAEEQVADELTLLVRNAEGQQCASDVRSELHGGPYGYQPVVAYAELERVAKAEGYGAGGCGEPGRYHVVLRRASENARSGPGTTANSDDLLPIELVVTLEPPVATAAGLPGPIEQDPSDVPALPEVAPVREVTGGAGFSDAPLLEPGTYRDSIRCCGTVFYRVRLEFGERLRWTVRAKPVPGRTTRWGDYTATLGTLGYTPVREPMTTYDAESISEGYPESTKDYVSREAVVKDVTYPVMYRNREAGLPQDVAGDYFVHVRLWDGRGMEASAVPFTLTVAVDGTPSGAPRYTTVGGSAEASPAADGTGASREDPAAAAREREAERPSAVTLAAYVGGGMLVLVAALVGAFLLADRRRRSRS